MGVARQVLLDPQQYGLAEGSQMDGAHMVFWDEKQLPELIADAHVTSGSVHWASITAMVMRLRRVL